MKLHLSGIVAAVTLAFSPMALHAQSDTLASADRVTMQREMAASMEELLASLAGVSEAQWRYKPAPDRWSIAEVAEHIVATDELIGNMVMSNLPPIMALPADSAARVDQHVAVAIRDRTRKFDAPPVIQPAGKYSSQAELLQALAEARNTINEYVRTTRDPLRARGLPHPVMGPLDGVQWILLLAAHEGRHTQQIEEVKQSAGYPR